MKEIFYERAAKSNKKQLKTKKPQSVLRNFGGVFNPNLKNKKEEFKNLKSKNEEKKPTNEYEIEIWSKNTALEQVENRKTLMIFL